MNDFYLTTKKPQFDFFSFVFLEENDDTKNIFQN